MSASAAVVPTCLFVWSTDVRHQCEYGLGKLTTHRLYGHRCPCGAQHAQENRLVSAS